MLLGVDVGVVYMKCVLCDGEGVSVVCDEHGNRVFVYPAVSLLDWTLPYALRRMKLSLVLPLPLLLDPSPITLSCIRCSISLIVVVIQIVTLELFVLFLVLSLDGGNGRGSSCLLRPVFR